MWTLFPVNKGMRDQNVGICIGPAVHWDSRGHLWSQNSLWWPVPARARLCSDLCSEWPHVQLCLGNVSCIVCPLDLFLKKSSKLNPWCSIWHQASLLSKLISLCCSFQIRWIQMVVLAFVLTRYIYIFEKQGMLAPFDGMGAHSCSFW